MRVFCKTDFLELAEEFWVLMLVLTVAAAVNTMIFAGVINPALGTIIITLVVMIVSVVYARNETRWSSILSKWRYIWAILALIPYMGYRTASKKMLLLLGVVAVWYVLLIGAFGEHAEPIVLVLAALILWTIYSVAYATGILVKVVEDWWRKRHKS